MPPQVSTLTLLYTVLSAVVYVYSLVSKKQTSFSVLSFVILNSVISILLVDIDDSVGIGGMTIQSKYVKIHIKTPSFSGRFVHFLFL